MVSYASIQHKIDKGIGIAARKLGPPYSAYRVTDSSNGDFPGGWTQVTASFPLFTRRITAETKLFLGIKNTAQYLDLVGDMEPYLLGDVFLLIDPPYDPGVSYGAGATSIPGTEEINAAVLAWHVPVRVPVGARLDHLARITRPSSSPATVSTVTEANYWKTQLSNDQPLVLAGGTYSFGSPQDDETAGSLVPVGFYGQNRRGEAIFRPDVPGMPRLAYWFVYVPPLPGYEPTEGDAILLEDGSRYVVMSPFTEETGVVGHMLIVDRKVSQVA